MKLVTVEIANFRSIREVTIELDPSCRVLVGINESGKSNVLKALRLLDPGVKPARKDDVRESLPDEDEISDAHIRFYLRLEKGETDRVFSLVHDLILSTEDDPIIASRKGTSFTLSAFCSNYDDVRYYVDLLAETKEFRSINIKEDTRLIGEWKKPGKACPTDFNVANRGKNVPLSEMRLVDAASAATLPPEYLADADIGDFAKLLSGKSNTVAEENSIKVISWEYDEKNLLPSQISIDSFAADPSTCLPLKNMFSLAGISDIASELARVKAFRTIKRKTFFTG